MKYKKCILVISLTKSSFVESDIKILQSNYEVKVFVFNQGERKKGWKIIKRWLEELMWLILHWRRSDLVFGWFLDHHMVLPVLMAKLFNRPVVVCLGGFDCMKIPELNYGVFTSRWRGMLVKLVAQHIDRFLPVTDKIVFSENTYTAWPDKRAFGIKAQIPDLRTSFYALPTGYREEDWPLFDRTRKHQICTVALINSPNRILIKGIDLYINAAHQMPEINFLIVGVEQKWRDYILSNYISSSNVILIPPVSQDELALIYNESKVYAQLSRTEGLPNVLCEAMLCGCVPVGSNIFGIPEVMGEYGYLVNTQNTEVIVSALTKALKVPDTRRKQIRKYILDHFTFSRRKNVLLNHIEQCMQADVGLH